MSFSELIDVLHKTDGQLVYVAAGAGTEAITALFGRAGASNTMLESLVPYAKASLTDFIGSEPKKYVSQETALRMAGCALVRAQDLARAQDLVRAQDLTQAQSDVPLLGVACTAAIATNRPKQGEHRAYVAVWSARAATVYSLTLEKGARTRADEEHVVSSLVLNAIAEAYALVPRVPDHLGPNDLLAQTTFQIGEAVQQVLAGSKPYMGVHREGRVRFESACPQVILPGSFNPLHAGHTQLAAVAEQLLEQPVAFELAVSNVDKGVISADNILSRLTQFAGRYPVYVSQASRFIDKARLFRGPAFVVGYDTAVRIVDPRYYNDSDAEMLATLEEIQSLGSRFVVAGRVGKDQHFYQLADISIPASIESMFISLKKFRIDLSSTELRASR